MPRKLIPVIMVLALVLSAIPANVGWAAPAARVVVNGQQLKLDVAPTFIGGRLLVPLRAIFTALGAEIEWNDATQTVTAVKGGITIRLTIGQKIAYKNGAAVTLDVPGRIISGRTLVPLRFVGEALGCQVGWEDASQTATVTGAGETPVPTVGSSEQKFVGLWGSSAELPLTINPDTGTRAIDPETGNQYGTYDHEWFEFRPDGTFINVRQIPLPIYATATIAGAYVTKGKFSVQGSSFIFTSLKEAWYPLDKNIANSFPAYSNRAKPDKTLNFEVNDNNTFTNSDWFGATGFSTFYRVQSVSGPGRLLGGVTPPPAADQPVSVAGIWSAVPDAAFPFDETLNYVGDFTTGFWPVLVEDDVAGIMTTTGRYEVRGQSLNLFEQMEEWSPASGYVSLYPAYKKPIVDAVVPCRSADTALVLTESGEDALYYNVSGSATRTQPPAPPVAANGSVLGLWCSTGAYGLHTDPATGLPKGDCYNGRWLEFHADGTFREVWIYTGAFQYGSGTCQRVGRYRLSGSEITFTNIRETWSPAQDSAVLKPAYSNKAVDDQRQYLSFNEDGNLRIADSPDESAFFMFYYRAPSN
jgi:hypothetical protein